WELTELADLFVARVRLHAPWGHPCILWTCDSWQTFAKHRCKKYDNRYSRPFTLLVHNKFILRPTANQGPSFVRVAHYMAAAIAWRPDLSNALRDKIVGRLVDEMQRYKKFYQHMFLKDKGIISRRKEWLDKSGR
ncbi:uncharacterized protein BDZ83DRAFT_595487, partial [Colletotrichum acutatum]